MIDIKTLEISGLAPAIKGMRNAYQSWQYNDSYTDDHGAFVLGEMDKNLAQRLASRGGPHAKYRRMIKVYADITAPLYWWKEFDTYKIGTVANSTSTMNSIHKKEFELDDFSHEHLDIHAIEMLRNIVDTLNVYRKLYTECDPNDFEIKGCPSKKLIWWQMIQLLPSSYNQLRTVEMNYEVLAKIVQERRHHKLDEWRDFCKWIDNLPYSDTIIGGFDNGCV